MVNINWTNEAEFWLKDIHDYIALDKKSIAKKVVNEIFNKVQILQSFPKIGYEYLNDENKEIRILLYGHYRIAYLIKNENTIDILGVFHGALDIERYL
ncbi:plasmid stabilization protein [Arcobacter sp. CECT 8983]|uniref:type II toxin-antitoxin system RelE/ParE family toxin n=1 Tax=Arcobacter sp. CECT 8983 TaxID=2044508 RepID=UPI00100B332F|nr:type II toxin-antitoxin system RelE/ParE family toxin [Arcobacter sp. CECT 8983]RXJ90689.1 plasmid stabilization protein [Arcobacter sp. CECT 8983]